MGLKRTGPALIFPSLACLSWLCATAHATEIAPPSDVSCGLHSPGQTYSADDIGGMFDRPKGIEHLLRNLKLAMDKDLLLQPGFYTAENLQKFFNGVQVKWSTPGPHMEGLSWRLFEVTTDRNVFPKMTVELLRSCQLIPAYTSAAGTVPAHITAVATVDLPVDDVLGFTVGTVRSVLGTESFHTMDFGEGTDGGRYTPTSKGSLTYEGSAKERRAQSGVERSLIKFFVRRDSPAALAAGGRSWEIGHDNQIESIHLWSREGAANGALSSQVEREGSHAPASPPRPLCGSLWHLEDKVAIARVGSMFVRPANVPQLLKNLKLAYDKQLLLLGEFYDEGNLIRFFGSERITSPGRLTHPMPGVTNRIIELAGGDGVLGQLRIDLTFSCLPQREYKSATGVTPAHIRKTGGATVTLAARPNFTVNTVRAVLGKESRFLPESFGPHDPSPTGKGLLIYETPADYRNGRATKTGAEISFRINLSLTGRGPEYVNEPLFTGDDVVESVEIFESEG